MIKQYTNTDYQSWGIIFLISLTLKIERIKTGEIIIEILKQS